MKIMTICDQGNNRSVTFAHLLKYKYPGSDVIAIGLGRCSVETQKMLFDWADYLIVTDKELYDNMEPGWEEKKRLWDVGKDVYPRPFNKYLYQLAKDFIENNPLEEK